MIKDRKFICYFYFVGWSCISLGLTICFAQPNIEFHMPFGFIRIGWSGWDHISPCVKDRIFGYGSDIKGVS